MLHDHVRTAVSSGQAALVGSLPPEQNMQLSIVLPLRNQAELTSLLGRLYDPASPDYRHFLSVDQFTQQFGPTAEDYQAVVEFAQASGFTVTCTPANRMIVPISGSVAQINRALNLRMNVYQHPAEKRTFYSPDREPSLNLTVPIAHIAGLNNFSIPRPMFTRAQQGQAIAEASGSGPGGNFLGSDMRAAYYGGTNLTGAGQVVGLWESYSYDINDVNLAFSSAGQSYSVPINNVLLDGMTVPVAEDDFEPVLDIVQAIGMAPGLSQVRVYLGNNQVDIFNAMATENVAKQLSVSYIWEPDNYQTLDPIFEEFAAQGQTLFASSGDNGAYQRSVPSYFPAEDVYVTAVGGTSLVTSGAGGTWSSETAWIGSGGGVGPFPYVISIPAWQDGVANSSNGGSTTLRNVPDVAMDSDWNNYSCQAGSCSGGWAGTSFSTPRWAGFMALVNQQAAAQGKPPLGFIDQAIYSIGQSAGYGDDFHDIFSGNNDYDGQTVWYSAVPGYDLVTGWGSPNGQSLIDALAGGYTVSASPSSLTVTQGGSGTTTLTVTDEGGFTGSVNLAASGLPGGLTASFNPNPSTGTSELTMTASSSVVPGNYLATIAGTSEGLTVTTTLSVTVTVPVKTTPTITWATPAPITYGTALSATQLNASTTVAGNVAYSPAAGTVLSAGPQTLSVTFTPTDTTDYTTATANVTLTVSPATPSISWATPAAITYGTALSATQLNASATVAGTFAYSPALGALVTAGQQTLTATFTPTDSTDYSTTTKTVQLTVNKAAPTITWATPSAITYGTPLSSTQLNATSSSVAGSFVYTPGSGTVLAAGSQTLSVTFTPTDTSDYNSANGSVTLTVNKATPTVTVAPSSSSITTAQVLSVTVSVSAGGGNPAPTGSVTLTGGGYTSAATNLSGGDATINISAGSLTTGTDTLTANYLGDTNYNAASGINSVTVTTAVSSSFTVSGTAVSVAPGATSGNTSTITIAPVGGFTGIVALTAAISSCPTDDLYPPTLSFSSTSQVNITSTTAGTATLTFTTTAPTSSALVYPKRPGVPWYAGGGAVLAGLLLLGKPARRRYWRTMLGILILLAALTASVMACGGGSGGGGGGGGGGGITGTTAGTYTITVTGTSGTITQTGTVTLNVQ
jgi:hypothetical protein